MSDSTEKKSAPVKSHSADIPLAEWLTGAGGLLIVAVAVGVLLHEAVAGDKSPPDIKLTVAAVEPLRNGYLVKVRGKNEGGSAAARVAIEVDLLKKAQVVEQTETQFEYLPAHSTREAGAFFTSDPRDGELRLRARGFDEP